jgi:hypothetical protein
MARQAAETMNSYTWYLPGFWWMIPYGVAILLGGLFVSVMPIPVVAAGLTAIALTNFALSVKHEKNFNREVARMTDTR